jgi:hypothetical protein
MRPPANAIRVGFDSVPLPTQYRNLLQPNPAWCGLPFGPLSASTEKSLGMSGISASRRRPRFQNECDLIHASAHLAAATW